MGKKVENKNSSRERVSKCAVCMQKNSYVTINCVHKFCMRCITRWVKRNQSCPLCRTKITQIRHGKKVKVIQNRRKDEGVQNQPYPHQQRRRITIAWKPYFFVPYMNYYYRPTYLYPMI